MQQVTETIMITEIQITLPPEYKLLPFANLFSYNKNWQQQFYKQLSTGIHLHQRNIYSSHSLSPGMLQDISQTKDEMSRRTHTCDWRFIANGQSPLQK